MIEVPSKTVLAVTLLVLAGAVVVLGSGGSGAGPAGGGGGDGAAQAAGGPVSVPDRSERIERKSANFSRAPRIVDPDGFVNTDNVTIQEYVGEKVIFVEFWTYSCANCQATHPYVKEWHRTYKDDGLVVITIHAPEFDFEKKRANVEDAVDEAGITYPVVQDNDFQTWDNWDNRYWPTRYLVGIDGFVRYKHIGEGAYDETERKIQELLAEREAVLNGSSEGE